MALLGEVASSRAAALYVVKVGSGSLQHSTVFAELSELRQRGASLRVVAGGAAGIAEYYRRIGRDIRTLTSRSGNEVRYCPPDELPHVMAAYEHLTLPLVEEQFGKIGVPVLTIMAHKGSLVTAKANGPLRVTDD